VAEQTRQRLRILDEHFPQTLPEGLLERGEKFAPAEVGTERRNAPRRGGRQAQVIVFPVTSAEVVMAWVGDWSSSGIGLWLPRPLEVGSLIYVLPDDSPEAATGALAEVRYCRPHDEGWAVGCRLVRSAVSSEQLFGA
jgi:hypothetical protein